MAIASSLSEWFVTDRAATNLRTRYEQERAIIAAESGPDATVPPAFLDPTDGSAWGRVMIGDGRLPMQHDTQVLLECSGGQPLGGKMPGVGRMAYTLTVTCQHRSQVYATATAAGTDPAWETTNAGHRTVQLLARTVQITLLRNMMGGGIYMFRPSSSAPVAPSRGTPDIYAWRMTFSVAAKVLDPVHVAA